MARATKVDLIDDIDGSTEDVQTVKLTYKGTQMEIELSASHRKELDEVLDRFLRHARRYRGNPVANTTGLTTAENRRIREWADSQGIPVKGSGRIPSSVVAKWIAAGERDK